MSSIMNPYVSMGGSTDTISYPLASDTGYDYNEDVDDAVHYAGEALAAADRLLDLALTNDEGDQLGNKLINAAVESYIQRFEIPQAALEDASDEVSENWLHYGDAANDDTAAEPKARANTGDAGVHKTSRLKKVILYLYAVVERVFNAVFDLFSSQKGTARELIPVAKTCIGSVDSFSASVGNHVSIKNATLLADLNIEGVAPKDPKQLFEKLSSRFETQHPYNAVAEVVRLINATKGKNQEEIIKQANYLRSKLEEGFKTSMKLDNGKVQHLFDEKKTDSTEQYASEPLFGNHHIIGTIGKEVSHACTFRYSCALRKDKSHLLTVKSLPVLSPDEIRDISRISIKVCQNIIRFSRDEELLKKALREAAFVKTKTPDPLDVVALRNMTAVGQNSYIVHLRYIARTTKALMGWCTASIKAYEGVHSGQA